MRKAFKSFLLLLAAGLTLNLGLLSCANDDSSSSSSAQTVKVITVTNGTANAGENVEISKLSTYLSTRGGKLYAELACTTEVALTSVKAGSTYYAKVTSTTNTKVKVITVTNGTANAGEDVEIANLSTYLSTRGGKLYAEQACTTEVAIANVKAGTTYYAKVTSTTPTTNTKVKVITVTNGTAGTGEDVELSALQTFVNGKGGKLYSDAACTTEVEVAKAVAGSTYYVKVTTTTTSTDVYIITYYLTDANNVSSKTQVAEQKIAIAKLADYIKYRGNKVYAKDDRTGEVAVSAVVGGTTYYVFYDDNAPKIKVWKVKDGTGTTTPELIKENNDDGFDNVHIAYLDKYLKEKKVSTLYAWTNGKQGAAVASTADAVTNNAEYCIVYLPAAAGTYTFTKNGKNYTLTTTAEGTYSMKEGTTDFQAGKFGLTKSELYTIVEQQVKSIAGMTMLAALDTGTTLEVTYTITGTTLAEKTRKANFVTISTVYSGTVSSSLAVPISSLKEYLTKANNAKLWTDKNKTKEVSPDAVEAEKEYFVVY